MYNTKVIKYFIGNCLELADIGILNHVNCKNFTGGCPDSHYFSDEIYRCMYNVSKDQANK